ncbi:MAG: iron-sulfur cluster assembly accessory protein [Pseudomonadota bacterium]
MSTANITVSPSAHAHIARQLAQTQSSYLRLGVKESGCNGYMYMLDFLDDPTGDDHCIDVAHDLRICVRTSDLALVEGTEIDLLTQGLNSALVFKNSHATSYCGCGESFALAAGDNNTIAAGESNTTAGGEAAGNMDVDQLGTDVGAS